MSVHTLEYKGVKVRYSDSGNGDVLVLLHGFMENLEMWNAYLERLSPLCRVIAVDLPGHGHTGVFGEAHTMEDNASLVKHVLDSAGVKQCIVIGHSMGGYVTLAFAELYPSMVRGLGLFHSTAFADTEEKKEERRRSVFVVKADHRRYVNELVPKLFNPDTVEMFAEEVQQMKAMGCSMQPEAIVAALLGMSTRPDRTEVLKASRVPVLFIWGRKDSVLPVEKQYPLGLLPACSQVLVLEKAGHAGFAEAADECYYAIKGFSEMCFSGKTI
jgi:pimeloyl-ACP methyl ester carboxylesterase